MPVLSKLIQGIFLDYRILPSSGISESKLEGTCNPMSYGL